MWTGPKIIFSLWKDEALEFCLCCILQSVFASFMMILGTQEHIGAITFVKSYINYKVWPVNEALIVASWGIPGGSLGDPWGIPRE